MNYIDNVKEGDANEVLCIVSGRPEMFTGNACCTPVQTLLLRNEPGKMPVSPVGEISQSDLGNEGIRLSLNPRRSP